MLHSTLLQHVFKPFFLIYEVWWDGDDGDDELGVGGFVKGNHHHSQLHASLRLFRSPWLSSPYTKYFAIIMCFWFVSQIKYIYIYNVFLQVSFLCIHHFCCHLQKDLPSKMRASSHHVKLSNPEIKIHLPSSSLAGIPYPLEPPTWKKKTTSSQATWFISHFSSNIHNNIHNGDSNNNNNNNNNNNKAPAFTVLLWEFLLPPLQTFSFMAPHLETQGHLNNSFHQSPMWRWLKRLLHFEWFFVEHKQQFDI